MIGRLNHVALAVADLSTAIALYRETFGAVVSEAVEQPTHGVITVFVDLPNTKIELLHPLGSESPIRDFLLRHPRGGIHHLCYEVEDLEAARERLVSQGMTPLGPPKIGAHGKLVLFLSPKDCCGTLIELEER